MDSTFGVPGTPRDPTHGGGLPDVAVHQSAPGDTVATPEKEVQWANSELLTIASTIEELQGRLAEANSRLSNATKVEATEVEIGRLFVEAQRFSEESLSRLEIQVHEVLREAEAKAKQIIAEATEEAHEIRRQAHQSAFVSTQAAQELQSAITGFTGVNSALLKELSTLNSMLTPEGERGTNQINASSTWPSAIEREHPNGSSHTAGTDPG